MGFIKRLFGLLLLLIFLLLGASAYYVSRPLDIPALPVDFSLQPGSSLKSAAHQLKQIGVLDDAQVFILLGRSMGLSAQIKYGSYQLTKPVSMYELLEIISKGRVAQSDLTIIEGCTFKQFREALNAAPKLRHDSLSLSDAEIMQRIGASEKHPEGLFFPDTYNFPAGSSDLALIKRAYHTMQRHLQENWESRDKDLPLESPYQALILASIVEKETGKAKDRTMIASVFVNRLRKGMRLQTDPTVIYGIGDKYDGNIRKRDLLKDSEYNTYTRYGLTPTPIALPGKESLHAALHPANSDALYFVARGDGSSQFSSTLSEHNEAVNRYQLKIK
ncbi:MAG TPA: endolytic transglycosylase MltG [Gallionellaceae bacterium]|nr:endolytic transglycosylase MltG [Gallionellaceae bacterium]